MAKKPGKSRGLGRGLSALMSDVALETDARENTTPTRRAEMAVPVEQISPNPDQPRRSFSDPELQELAASIRENGIIQPLIVRRTGETSFQIVAGERRWRAAQLAQLHEVPVVIRDLDDTQVLEFAIIENIQREDLNPLEEGAGYQQLMESFGHTQEKLAEAMGKSRSYIANLMRLLQLPDDVQELLRSGKLSSGHARALITSENASELAKKVIKDGLSVRETERLAKSPKTETKKAETAASRPEKDADTKALEGDLKAATGMKVDIAHDGVTNAGKLSISYASLDQLDEICRVLSLIER
ncbi:ParB/RepB/Spo0J family partition protein [Cognatishimia sp. MH4019]|uniref:ParB/RepB/Spo0J family partition protein n=1 Tax=Cognatishimia sp. MH4019 TaxID=2854030 RepID=UPI001CD4307A|nr:ParB/RepB/Spo0J family partition protein [Cognatishimia sp. MH4019]